MKTLNTRPRYFEVITHTQLHHYFVGAMFARLQFSVCFISLGLRRGPVEPQAENSDVDTPGPHSEESRMYEVCGMAASNGETKPSIVVRSAAADANGDRSAFVLAMATPLSSSQNYFD